MYNNKSYETHRNIPLMKIKLGTLVFFLLYDFYRFRSQDFGLIMPGRVGQYIPENRRNIVVYNIIIKNASMCVFVGNARRTGRFSIRSAGVTAAAYLYLQQPILPHTCGS